MPSCWAIWLARSNERGEERAVRRLGDVDAGDVPARHDEHMHRRGGIAISKGHYLRVGIDLGTGEQPSHDTAKRAVRHRRVGLCSHEMAIPSAQRTMCRNSLGVVSKRSRRKARPARVK